MGKNTSKSVVRVDLASKTKRLKKEVEDLKKELEGERWVD